MRWLSRLVSVAVTVTVVALLFLLLRSKVPETHVHGKLEVWALFRDGSRLATGSPVMIAGVRVGEVRRLTVEGTFARIDMVLRDDTNIPDDSWVTKRAESAFGDSYLEIIPGGGEEGATAAARLHSGMQIKHVIEGGSTDTALRAVAKTMPKIDRGLEAMHDFALTGRQWASGPLEDALIGADRWVTEGHIEKPIESADRAMKRFEDGTTSAADSVARARPNVNKTFDRLDKAVASARTQIVDLKHGLHDGLANARDGVDRIDPTIRQYEDVVVAINEGRGEDFKGRFGRLVNDPGLADSLDDLSDAARDATSGLDVFHSWLGFRAEYNVFAKLPRVYVTAELRARNDKFFLVELEKGPIGSDPIDQLRDQPNTAQFDRYQQIQEQIRFTAEFGKRLGPVQIRAGLKESTFGLGSDILLNRGKLRFSLDAFGGFTKTPRVKLVGAIEVFRSFYLLGGVDDALENPRYLNISTGNTDVPTYFERVRLGRDYFLGATLQFSDADLAMLVRVYGAMLAGLAL